MNYSIRFLPKGQTFVSPEGDTLLNVMRKAGLSVDAPCGGNGTCGKCSIEYRFPGETVFAQALACQTLITGDMEVRLPDSEGAVHVLTEGYASAREALHPMVHAVKLQVAPCQRGQSVPDWARLCAALDDKVGHRNWQPSVHACSTLGSVLNRTRGEVWVLVCGHQILEISESKPAVYMAAIDLGTTTIAGCLVNEAGKTVARRGIGNPQAQYGADVIARADYAISHGIRDISMCVREALNDLLLDLCTDAGIPADQVYAVMMAGNTTMHHLFLGISPDSLVRAPYNPVIGEPLSLPARDYAFQLHPEARLYMLPVIGGFVGADTVACLLSGDWSNREPITLMIDIGTNGELVLGNRHRRLACSTAAGPALEGAKITCGMRAVSGAIDHVWVEEGELRWHVIGDCPARGLCGSGLVDLIAALLQTETIDGSGRLALGDRLDLGDTGVYLTQKDVREVQLAKGAIAAGICLLCDHLGIDLEQIEEVDIAGAFGNYLKPDSACAIGLIPSVLRDRIMQVGNAAGEGARLVLLEENYWTLAEVLARDTQFIELATLPEFQDEFVEQLSFSDEDDE